MRSTSFPFLFWVFALPVQAQTDFNGTFTAVVEGTTCRFITQTNYGIISGTYEEENLSLQVSGTFLNKVASGDLKDKTSGQVVTTFKAVLLDKNKINLTFSLAGQDRSHLFLRQVSTVNQINPKPKKYTRDLNLAGNWSYHVITGNTNGGFQTVLYFQINANGRYTQYSKSVGGGSDWAYNSGQMELQQKGWWYSDKNTIYLRAEGQADYLAAATYRFYQGKLVTEDVNGRKIWIKE